MSAEKGASTHRRAVKRRLDYGVLFGVQSAA
jgi:hypothetical protein